MSEGKQQPNAHLSEPLDLSSDDEIEIIEVVGLDEDSPAATGVVVTDGPKEVIVEIEDDDQPSPLGSSSSTGKMSDRERFMRLQADFENFKKRVERERQAHELQATSQLVRRILPVLDNLERALGLEPDPDNDESLRNGLILVFRQILDELRKEGLDAIESVGKRFNPHLHDAVETDAYTGQEANLVLEEFQRGYRFNGRLLRPARVKVSVDRAESTEHSEEDREE